MALQEKDVFNSFLNLADVHLVLQKQEASDLVMPSKLLNILSVGGLVIVTAAPTTTLFDMIADNNMGIIIPPEDEDALKNAILNSCKQDLIFEKENARKYAEKCLSKNSILKNMLEQISNT